MQLHLLLASYKVTSWSPAAAANQHGNHVNKHRSATRHDGSGLVMVGYEFLL